MRKRGNIDWRKPNNLIALELGLSRERVRQMRVERGARAPVITHVPKHLLRQCWAIWEKRILIMRLPPRIAEKHLGFKFTQSLLRFAQEHAGLTRGSTRHPWERMNWELPTTDLARIWKMQKSDVQVYRSKNKCDKARWHALKRIDRQDANYHRAVAAEMREAASVLNPNHDRISAGAKKVGGEKNRLKSQCQFRQ